MFSFPPKWAHKLNSFRSAPYVHLVFCFCVCKHNRSIWMIAIHSPIAQVKFAVYGKRAFQWYPFDTRWKRDFKKFDWLFLERRRTKLNLKKKKLNDVRAYGLFHKRKQTISDQFVVWYSLNVTIAITITRMPNLIALFCDLCDSSEVDFSESSLNSTLDTSPYSWNSDFRTVFLASIILHEFWKITLVLFSISAENSFKCHFLRTANCNCR